MKLKPEDIDMVSWANSAGTSVAGWVGILIAILVPAGLGLRRWLSGDATARAMDRLERDLLSTLMQQLESANQRADQFAQERNEAIHEIGELKAQIAQLQSTVDYLQAQLDLLLSQNAG